MKALIIVDVQLDFTEGGSLEVPKGGEVVPAINKLQEKLDLVVATQDWHPQNHLSFASNHSGKRPFEKINLEGMEQVLWPDHCVPESEGAKLHPHLSQARIEAIFRKGMDPGIDSYSAFFDNGHKKSTGLGGYLKDKGVSQVYLCGLAEDVCVFYSAKDAVKLGLEVFVIRDACAALDLEDAERKKWELEGMGVRFIDVSVLY